MSLEVWILAFVVSAGAAALQGTVGLGYGLVAVPVVSLIDPSLSPVPQLITVLPLALLMAWKERQSIDLSGVGWLVIGRFPGAAIGLLLLSVASQQTLDVFVGTLVLVAVAIIGFGLHVTRTPLTKFLAGVASGTTSLVASIGGPPVALLYSSAEKAMIRSTLALVFTFGVSFSLLVRQVTGNIAPSDWKAALVFAPAVVVGWAVSLRFKDRIPQTAVRASALIASAAAAIGLLIRAAVG